MWETYGPHKVHLKVFVTLKKGNSCGRTKRVYRKVRTRDENAIYENWKCWQMESVIMRTGGYYGTISTQYALFVLISRHFWKHADKGKVGNDRKTGEGAEGCALLNTAERKNTIFRFPAILVLKEMKTHPRTLTFFFENIRNRICRDREIIIRIPGLWFLLRSFQKET